MGKVRGGAGGAKGRASRSDGGRAVGGSAKKKHGTSRAGSALVLGVGNILLRDEGFGVRAVEYIQKNYNVPDGVTVLDGGTGGLGLISVITGYETIIIIDAVAAGSPPGTFHRLDGDTLKSSPPVGATAHQLGVRDMLAIAGLEGITPDVVVIGVEPRDISAGLELSGLMEARVPEAARMVAGELSALGYELTEKKSA